MPLFLPMQIVCFPLRRLNYIKSLRKSVPAHYFKHPDQSKLAAYEPQHEKTGLEGLRFWI